MNGAYVVYQPIHINTLGIKVAKIIRIYVPIELRGQGIASKLKDLIPEKTVLEEIIDGDKTTNYRTVATLKLVRGDIQQGDN